MRTLLTLSLVAAILVVSYGSVQLPFNQEELDFFKSLKFDVLPRELKLAIRKDVRTGDSSNWCCKNNIPIKSIQRSKVSLENIKVQTKVKVGYTKCNFMGVMMCPTYDVRYEMQPTYFLEYYEVPDPHTCKEQDIKCCDSHLQVAGNCIAVSTAAKYTDELLKLKENGLLDLVG